LPTAKLKKKLVGTKKYPITKKLLDIKTLYLRELLIKIEHLKGYKFYSQNKSGYFCQTL
jgi:hypothetical protein